MTQCPNSNINNDKIQSGVALSHSDLSLACVAQGSASCFPFSLLFERLSSRLGGSAVLAARTDGLLATFLDKIQLFFQVLQV